MSKYVVMAGWNDVPHLSTAQKADLLVSIPSYQRDARSKGIPQLGSGAIYPVPESEITVDDFLIPAWWPRGFGLDVGWNFTAWGFLARDPDSGVTYLYDCMKVSGKRPAEVAKLILSREGRIRGVIDPAARGRGQADGEQLLQTYRDLGLDIVPANNSVEAGIYEVWQRLTAGRFKIFRKAGEPSLAEYRMYQRDENGKIVKANDHLMDGAWRYPVMSFLVDGMQMSTPVRKQADEDSSMWAALGKTKNEGKTSPVASEMM